jgi:hypothetical protein
MKTAPGNGAAVIVEFHCHLEIVGLGTHKAM